MKTNLSRTKTLAPSSEKREAILRAALEVFSEFGVHGVAVPEIASRAGVGIGTIYRYFDSKEALVNELFQSQKAALRHRLRNGLDPHLSPRALFKETWNRLVAFAREEPQAFRFLEMQDHLAYLNTASRDIERRIIVPMAFSVRSLQRSGVFRRDIRAEVMMALMWGALVNLFKAEQGGYLKLSAEDIARACDACWRICAVEPASEE